MAEFLPPHPTRARTARRSLAHPNAIAEAGLTPTNRLHQSEGTGTPENDKDGLLAVSAVFLLARPGRCAVVQQINDGIPLPPTARPGGLHF